MKTLLISTLLMLGLASTSIGQSNSFGLSIGTGKGMIMKRMLEGGPSYDLNASFSVGLQYSRKLTNKLHLVTGVNWYKSEVTVTPSFYPGMDRTPENYDVQLIYVPVFLQVDLSKYFFVNGGLIADFDITKDKYITSQSGAGAGFGGGVKFSIKEKFSIQINPYLNFHGVLLADSEKYPERILDSGIRLNFLMNK